MNIGTSYQDQTAQVLNSGSVLNPSNGGAGKVVRDGVSGILYIFSPRILPTQILRPYVYNFSQQSVSALDEAINCSEVGGLNSPRFNNNLALQQAIVPDSNGINLNMDDINTKYTFVLYLLDRHAKAPLGIPQQIKIFMGYFTDDPVTSGFGNTPTCNPMSGMIITKQSLLTNFGQLSAGYDNMAPLGTSLLMSQPMTALVANNDNDLVVNTPGSILSTPYNSTNVYKDAANVAAMYNSYSVSNCLQNPKTQLRIIGSAIQQSVAQTEFNSPCVNELSGELGTGRIQEDFENKMLNHVRNREDDVVNVAGPLQNNDTLLLGQLFELYPTTEIMMCAIPPQSQWDVVSQDIISPQVTYSTMATATLNAICCSLGIYTLAFNCSSFKRNTDPMGLTNDHSNWNLVALDLIAPVEGEALYNQVKTVWENVITLMERDLFPILLSACGHFDIVAKYDLAGETLLSLKFKDYNSSSLNGFYETSNRFGGINCPLMGDLNTVSSNRTQLDNLANAFIGNQLSKSFTNEYNPQPQLNSQIANIQPNVKW